MKSLLMKLLNMGTLLGVLGLAAVYGLYEGLKPTELPLTVEQTEAVSDMAQDVAGWAAELEIPKRRSVFCTLGGDRFGQVSDPLRSALWRSGRLELADYSFLEKVARLVEWTRPTCASRQEAVKVAKRRNASYAVWGQIVQFSDVEGQAVVEVELEIVDAANGRLAAGETFRVVKKSNALVPGSAASLQKAKGRLFGLSFLQRLMIWLAATLILPLLVYPLSKRILTGDSNAAILGLLIAHVGISAAVAYFLLGQGGGGFVAAIVLILCFAVAMRYYWFALDQIKAIHE